MSTNKPWWMKNFHCKSMKGIHRLTVTPHWWACLPILCVIWMPWFKRYVWGLVDNATWFGCVAGHLANGDKLIGPLCRVKECKEIEQ